MTDEAWDELRTRDELAALTDGINAVDVERDIGSDPVKAGHYERAMDIRDQADAALGKEPRDRDLDFAQALILEGVRELHAAVPSAAAAPSAATQAAPTTPAFQVQAPLPPLVSGAQGLVSELLGEVLTDPQGFRERAKIQAAQIRAQAQVTGNSTVVMFSSGGITPLAGQPAPEQRDVADMLAKLAALRDRGALTEEEFQAQKKRLLDG
ncbi:MAG: SHOCT domain-containing protein [Actinomycetota bacterium]|nr:SHOCT domain-containing protein [Actinomycetota bacterium]